MVKRPMLPMDWSPVYVAPGFITILQYKFDSANDCRYGMAGRQDILDSGWDGWNVYISISSVDINAENSIQESPIHL